jgi:NAD(P)-dependent dehydrogenase (short-subunit alcohol dehydrogenase family)
MSVNNVDEQIDLSGQVAIVTGGGRGIGRGMAQALATAGASVAVVARTAAEVEETADLIETEGGRAIAIVGDVTDQAATEGMVAQVETALGPVDLLVSNAGILGPLGPSWEVDPDVWWRCLEGNLRGPFLCARAVLPGMVRRQRGRIITTASGAGLRAGKYGSAYAVAKCAAIRFMESLAAETSDDGISVFAIHPGLVRTAMTETLMRSPEEELWYEGRIRRRFAAGQDAPPECAAQLVLTLASGKADGLSGCYISYDDDLDEMVARIEEVDQEDLFVLRLRT